MPKALLLLFSAAAVWWDLKEHRIPNRLTAFGLLAGLLYQLGNASWIGLLRWLGGLGLAMLLPAALYCFRMIGAGDGKMLGVIGGFLGPAAGFRFTAQSFLIGGVISALLLIRRGNVYSRFYYLKSYILQTVHAREWRPYRGEGCEDGYLHFSVPVFISLLLLLAAGEL